MNKAIIALAALAVTGTAAAGPNWTYADFGYNRASSGNQDTDGYNVRGSIAFADVWHARLTYADTEVAGGKGSAGGTDLDGFELVVGAHPALNDSTDLVVELGYTDFDNDNGSVGGKVGTDGYILTTGMRTMWTDQLEISAGVSVSSLDTDGTGGGSGDSTAVIVNAGGQYLFTDNVGVGVDVANGGGAGNLANFYLRWNF